MPVGEFAGEAIGAVARFIGRIFVELVFELIVRGVGHAVLKLIRPSVEPGETEQAVVGFLVLITLIAFGVWAYHAAA
jgi:hypothetical protein